ncbi:hypothetical protein A8B78_21515 [Jannaschia sp. EhC01]|nr:hypothetical protein A8B78_21515 [Jannaschia sp. EhC01]
MKAAKVPVPSPSDTADVTCTPGPARQSLAADTLIETATGMRPLQNLTVGEKVMTRAGTFQPITGIIHTHFTTSQLQDTPDLAPIRFDPGALPGMPEDTATLVSPDCPIAWAEGANGIDHFPARAFCDGGLIRRVIPEDGIHYIRLLFATPQEICAGNIWLELSREDRSDAGRSCRVPKLVQEIRVFRPMRA